MLRSGLQQHVAIQNTVACRSCTCCKQVHSTPTEVDSRVNIAFYVQNLIIHMQHMYNLVFVMYDMPFIYLVNLSESSTTLGAAGMSAKQHVSTCKLILLRRLVSLLILKVT